MLNFILEVLFGKPEIGDCYEERATVLKTPFSQLDLATVVGYSGGFVLYESNFDNCRHVMNYDCFLFYYRRLRSERY